MIPKNWKVTGLAALALGGLTGVAFADDGVDLIDRSDPIVLAPHDDDNDENTQNTTSSGDASSESPFDSAESDDGLEEASVIDGSAESADSPAESPFDSVESASDSADDAGFAGGESDGSAASPAASPADSPADTTSDDSPVSPESTDSAD